MKSNALSLTLASLIIGGAALTPALAEEAAKSTTQAAGQTIDDISVLTKIKADLLQTKNVDGLDVNVDVKDGRVTLSGTASNETERTTAESIAKSASGVKSVDNKIVLKGK